MSKNKKECPYCGNMYVEDVIEFVPEKQVA